MGPRLSLEAPEQKETNKIQETNLNLGLVNANEEPFSFKRVNRIEIGVSIIILILYQILGQKMQKEMTEEESPKAMSNKLNQRL